jgi:tRNA (mo5U34)-methyltransferase
VTLQSYGRSGGSADEVERQIADLAPWFHNLHLPGERQTAPDHPLGDFPAFKWRQLAGELPPDLTGIRALDIGCNAGYYSFQLAARGARVLGIDADERYLSQARWAAQWLDPDTQIEFAEMQVYDLAEMTEAFDLVLFMGVLYHLRHPQLALDLVARLVRGRLIFQTLTMPGASPAMTPPDLSIEDRAQLTAPGWPRAAFVEHSLAGDPGHELSVCEPAGVEDISAPAREAELRAATRSRQSPGSSQRK